MNKHTTLPNLMQKLVSDEEIQLIAGNYSATS